MISSESQLQRAKPARYTETDAGAQVAAAYRAQPLPPSEIFQTMVEAIDELCKKRKQRSRHQGIAKKNYGDGDGEIAKQMFARAPTQP